MIVTVADQAADPRGLWTADYDLLARLHGLDAIDVIATENVLAAGFHQRLHDLLPGIEEQRCGCAVGAADSSARCSAAARSLTARCHRASLRIWFFFRDREEELAEVATRWRRRRPESPDGSRSCFSGPCRICIWRARCLPTRGQPYQASTRCRSRPSLLLPRWIWCSRSWARGNRSSLVHLLDRRTGAFQPGRGAVAAADQVAALDAWLRELKYLGGWERLARSPSRSTPSRHRRRSGRATR